MKKMLMTAMVAVSALSFAGAANAADNVFGAAFGANVGKTDAGLNVQRATINKSDLGAMAVGASVSNDGEFTGDKFNVGFLAVGLNAGKTSATGNLTDSTLNGGGSIGGSGNGVVAVPGMGIAGQLAINAEDKSSFDVKAAGASVSNSFKFTNK